MLSTIALVLGVIALFAWRPWADPTETEWLGSYRAWSDELEASREAGLVLSRAECESSFDDEVGQPAQELLQPVAAAGRRGCAAATPAERREARTDAVRALLEAHDDVLPPRRRRDLASIARAGVGVRPDVYCWQPAGWAPVVEQYGILRGGLETSLLGIPDGKRNRIDLGPGVCSAFSWYVRRERPTALSYENFELAQAIVVLTHQAEHLKTPVAAENDVECAAVQHVRPLVRDVFGAEYAGELAQQAWELSYQRLPPEFRTPACRDGGPLDRNPDSNAWP